MNVLQLIALIAATGSMGLMAGVFYLYSHAIMPGLRKTDDHTFIEAFQQLDRAIEQPRFMPVVGGALVFPALAGLLHLGSTYRSVLPWVVAAFVLYFAAMAITSTVHIPRNHAMRAEVPLPAGADPAAIRGRFDEARWITWNLVRTVLTTTAFGLLAWALVVRGGIG
ncbi:DUF1772 domain-containing protein [Phytoactinopolyspora limicola]|uniref:anthrone oxygenase family protein n=1 Tax=Phytoactinopolyspora limicola TaxID=2715536 RepID=UPI001A9C367C|nr:DUF1772 domain-containing protein [Phytoactinopolyspora limicola]